VNSLIFSRRQKWIELAMLGLLLAGAAVFRLALPGRPGWELDEVVYARITANLLDSGYIWLTNHVPYLSHPPFYFYILATTYRLLGVGIDQARLLSAACQWLAIVALYLVLKGMIGRANALLATLFVSFDGWIVFTGRIGWMENVQLLFIIPAIGSFYWAQHSQRLRNYIVAGVLIGLGVVFKHVGGYLMLMVLINLLLQRRQIKNHLLTFLVASLVVGVYMLVMYRLWGSEFLHQYLSQFRRTIGSQFAPGLNYGLPELVEAITSRYYIFFTTIFLFAVGVPLTLYRAYQHVRYERRGDTTLLAWTLAAIVFFGVISLKTPHYFLLLLLPLCCIMAMEIDKVRHWRHIPIIAMVFLTANALTWNFRFVQHSDNLLADIQGYATKRIPLDAVIFSTEPVCSVIPQPCLKLEGRTGSGIENAIHDATWYLAYESTTQKFPSVPGDALDTLQGFKDRITIVLAARSNPGSAASSYPSAPFWEKPVSVPLLAPYSSETILQVRAFLPALYQLSDTSPLKTYLPLISTSNQENGNTADAPSTVTGTLSVSALPVKNITSGLQTPKSTPHSRKLRRIVRCRVTPRWCLVRQVVGSPGKPHGQRWVRVRCC
jgi:hypothetical protein